MANNFLTEGNFHKRMASIAIFVPLIAFCLYKGIPYTTGLIFTLYCVSLWEWKKVFSNHEHPSKIFVLTGYVIINFAFFYIMYLAQNLNIIVISFILLIVWIVDSGAYIFGKSLGKTNFFPSISPNKTWEGVAGGIVSSMVAFYFLSIYMLNKSPDIGAFSYVAFISCVAIAGDLLMSYAKRHFGVKDSSNLIPGHGGLLDRIDAIIFVCFVLSLIHYFGSINLSKEFLL